VEELTRNSSKEMVKIMHTLITKVWQTESMTEDWSQSIICPIYKKAIACKNYRSIFLLCATYRIFSKIIENRIRPLTEELIEEYKKINN